MLQALKQFFKNCIETRDKGEEDGEHRLRLATAALMIEMMRMDNQIKPEETAAVARLLQGKFGLSEEETVEVIRLAETEAREAPGYHQFTSLINQSFTLEQKVKVVEHLWEVAFADGRVDPHEEHLVRKLAELLYVPHTEFILAKHRVMEND